MTELTRRVLFSVVAAPLAGLIIYFGGWVLAATLGAIAGTAAWEVFRMARADGTNPMSLIGIALAALIPIFVHAHYLGLFTLSVAAESVIFSLSLRV